MQIALDEARRFEGATRPNPPVGAVILDENNHVMIACAHERAGLAHAERNAIERLRDDGRLDRARTLVVTLEPCAHHGQTPPCTDAIRETKIRRVIYGTKDLNPKVAGGGSRLLEKQGIEVIAGVLEKECRDLVAPFFKFATESRPWITVKTAHLQDGSMIAPAGAEKTNASFGIATRSGSNSNTFTRPSSLLFVHALRKRSDAILTGSGTLLTDRPRFNVRLIADHEPALSRTLAVLDRRNRVSDEQLNSMHANGLIPMRFQTPEEAFSALGRAGCLRVLVEAGPTLSDAILATNLWDEHIRIVHDLTHDTIERRLRVNK